MNKKLFRNIKKFYKKYDTTHYFEDTTVIFTKDDMYDYNALMSAYESIWFTLEDYEDQATCKFLTDLYGELGDYINVFENGKEHNTKAIAIVKLCVSIFGTMSIGSFVAVWIECGYDIMIVVGLALAIFVAVCSGIGAYEDIRIGE